MPTRSDTPRAPSRYGVYRRRAYWPYMVRPSVLQPSITEFTLYNSADGGSDEVTVTTSDVTSGDAWSAVNNNSGTGEVKWDTAKSHSGANSIRFTGGTTGGAFVRWDRTVGGQVSYSRGYLWWPTLAANNTICQPMNSGSGCASIRANFTSNKLEILDSTVTGPTASLKVFSANEQVRIETRVFHDTAAGTIDCRLFYGANLDGTTPDETLTQTGKNTQAACDGFRWGSINTGGATLWWDDFGFSNLNWLGPVVVGGSTDMLDPFGMSGFFGA